MTVLTPELIEAAYRRGVFPMADEDDRIRWYLPDPRAVIDLEHFHVSRRLGRLVRQGRFEIALDRDFEGVIRGCADRQETWINEKIVQAFTELHRRGRAHSIEAYREGRLAGGIYGMALGGAFMGESMFSRKTGASSVCLVHLVDHLRRRGYALFDLQFINPHLERFGAVEISCDEYLKRLDRALEKDCLFNP